jgi:carboxymethylenebutenolidase
MEERLGRISTPDGSMETFITHPRDGKAFPAVIFYMDIWGLREELFDVARRVATVGYYCMVPDLFYRQGRIRQEFRDSNRRTISFSRLSKAQQEAVLVAHTKLSDAQVVDDTRALLDFVDQREPVRHGALGCIGYCMGGRLAIRVAGALPGRFRACACLHGSGLVTDQNDSPHLGLADAQGELYCGFAELDAFASQKTIRTIGETMRQAKAKYHFEIHSGADHGYALPDRDIHDKSAANRDWEIIFSMFDRQLRAPAP